MREFQEKNQLKKRLYSKTSLFLLFLVLILVSKGVYGVYQKERDSRAEVERISAKKAELESRYNDIKSNQETLNTPEGIEAEIRTKFDVAKEGEGVIVVVERDSQVIEEDRRGILRKFWDSVVSVFKKDSKSTGDVKSNEKASQNKQAGGATSTSR